MPMDTYLNLTTENSEEPFLVLEDKNKNKKKKKALYV